MGSHAALCMWLPKTRCAFLSVHLCMYTYPVVFLEPLFGAGTAFGPPLWSVLRIKVKEPLSKGKLDKNEKKQKMDQGQRQRWAWRQAQRQQSKVCELMASKKKKHNRWWLEEKSSRSFSRREQWHWFPSSHKESIFRHCKTVLKSTIINHQGRQMRCIIQSFPPSTVCRLKTPLCFSNSQGIGQSSE